MALASTAVSSGTKTHLDWKKLTASEIYVFNDKMQLGSITLFHKRGLLYAEALPLLSSSTLLAEGYTIVPILEILLTGDTYIDHTDRQHAAST